MLELPFYHVLTASTVTYDQAKHCPIRLLAWTDNQVIGGGPRGRTRLRCNAIAYMKNRVSFPLINSHSSLLSVVSAQSFVTTLHVPALWVCCICGFSVWPAIWCKHEAPAESRRRAASCESVCACLCAGQTRAFVGKSWMQLSMARHRLLKRSVTNMRQLPFCVYSKGSRKS